MTQAEDSHRTYTVVTCHFGDLFWVSHMVQQVDRWSDGRVASVVVIDQNRSDRAVLESLPRVTQVLEFEPSAEVLEHKAHDHHVSLNRALRTVEFTTSHVLVLDSDCFPVHPSWLDRLDNITLAASGDYAGMTHPCLMAFPISAIPVVDFAEGWREFGVDTGRLVGVQLIRAGERVTLARWGRRRAFANTRGHWFLDRSVYHHGGASWVSSSIPGLRRHVAPMLEERYKRRVAAGSFTVTPAILVLLGLRRMKMRVRRRAVVVFRAMHRLLTR